MVNWKLEVKPEALTVQVFNDIFVRDKSKDKSVAIQELSYVYHMCDNRSDFSSYLDIKQRSDAVINHCIKIKNWQPDKLVSNAIQVYKELNETVTSRFLDSIRIALSKIDSYLRNFQEKDAESEDMARVNSMIKNSIETVKSVRELEKIVKQDKETADTLKGGRERGLYMDDED